MPWTLEVEGAENPRKIALKPGISITVGRAFGVTEVFPDDQWMSSLHFTVGVSGSAPRFQNLSKTNGTEINGERIETVALKGGDQIKAGQTVFVVREPSRSPFPSERVIGGWGFRSLPEGWTSTDVGYLLNKENVFKASIHAVEEPLPEDKTLDEYVQAQIDLANSKIPTLTIEPPIPIKLDGAEQAIALRMKVPLKDRPSVLQRQIYALHGGMVGIWTATVSEAELHQELLESVIRGLSYFQG